MKGGFNDMVGSISHYPPSFAGDSVAYAWGVFGLLGSCLILAEWLWRLVWKLRDDPHPLRHPATMFRVILIFLITGMLLRSGPDMAATMLWPEQTPEARATLAYVNRFCDGISFIPTSAAWFAAIFSRDVIEYQLKRQPIRVDLHPTLFRLKRGLMIGAGVFIISVAVAFG